MLHSFRRGSSTFSGKRSAISTNSNDWILFTSLCGTGGNASLSKNGLLLLACSCSWALPCRVISSGRGTAGALPIPRRADHPALQRHHYVLASDLPIQTDYLILTAPCQVITQLSALRPTVTDIARNCYRLCCLLVIPV